MERKKDVKKGKIKRWKDMLERETDEKMEKWKDVSIERQKDEKWKHDKERRCRAKVMKSWDDRKIENVLMER